MTIQTNTGNVEVGPEDKVFVINKVEYVLKCRKYGDDWYLDLGTNRGSGWDSGVFVDNNPEPTTGDAKAYLQSQLANINKIIAANSANPISGESEPQLIDDQIQALQVVGGKISF